MSNMMKLIIPLLDEALVKEDFTKEAGFINAYMQGSKFQYKM